MRKKTKLAEYLVAVLRASGVERIFGVPGGGSSLDIIAATAEQGMDFVLTQTESAAAVMAAVTAELGGAPGVVITGVGPGAASAVNGVAYASLERAPVLLISDCLASDSTALHQRFDQSALYAPLVKASRKLTAAAGRAAIDELLTTALTPPLGPVYADLSAVQAAAPMAAAEPLAARAAATPPPPNDVAAARQLLSRAQRPVLIAGLEARAGGAPAALRELADGLGCPVFTTYKAKGVYPDDGPLLVGHFTNAAAEAECLEQADLIIFFGLDPVEMIPRSWPYRAPVLALAIADMPEQPVVPALGLRGALPELAGLLRGHNRRCDWTPAEIAALRSGMRVRLAVGQESGLSPRSVVEYLQLLAPDGCRLTVDSGAHMFSAMAFWQAREANEVLKSNGLSTMAFALPAAIAAALHEPERPVVVVTGDGGLMMCLGELATAVRLGCRIVVVVCNDAALSLIDIKQRRQGRPRRGVSYPRVDLAGVARSLGCQAWRVEYDDELVPALAGAFAAMGVALVDVGIDAAAYAQQLEALRG